MKTSKLVEPACFCCRRKDGLEFAFKAFWDGFTEWDGSAPMFITLEELEEGITMVRDFMIADHCCCPEHVDAFAERARALMMQFVKKEEVS